MDDSFVKYGTNRRTSDLVMNNSYKIVNERIVKLKKFEFDFANLSEILKNYLIVQDIIIKCLFSSNTNEIHVKVSINIDEHIRLFQKKQARHT